MKNPNFRDGSARTGDVVGLDQPNLKNKRWQPLLTSQHIRCNNTIPPDVCDQSTVTQTATASNSG
jgi:hypothetical protein